MTAQIISLPQQSRTATRIPVEEAQGAMVVELRRARIRIAQLEASLTEAMRDNLTNFNRARDAERQLVESKV